MDKSFFDSLNLPTPKYNLDVGRESCRIDRQMPEEINGIFADHISDYILAPTNISQENLLREGISQTKIFITGNTIVDAVQQNLKIAQQSKNYLNLFHLLEKNYTILSLIIYIPSYITISDCNGEETKRRGKPEKKGIGKWL